MGLRRELAAKNVYVRAKMLMFNVGVERRSNVYVYLGKSTANFNVCVEIVILRFVLLIFNIQLGNALMFGTDRA